MNPIMVKWDCEMKQGSEDDGTVHCLGRLLGEDALPGVQQGLPVAHVPLGAGAREGGRRSHLLQLEEVQAHVVPAKEPAAPQAPTAVPAALVPNAWIVGPQEPQSDGRTPGGEGAV